jgi:nifR3 family TIM-barrel protein
MASLLVAPPPVAAPLRIGPLQVWPPVVLAPMAGITNAPFRALCRRFGAGLYVSEMVTARGLVEGWRRSLLNSQFGPDERPRSLQLYGTDPYWIGEAAALLAGEARIEHLDLNFGCPVRKVTRQGGGAALPLKRALFRAIVAAAVRRAGSVPVTVKLRLGIDASLLTYLEAGRIAAGEGAAAVSLHARTAAQLYAGRADWARIGELKAILAVPVLGNGDIFLAADALRMMRATGCDGVVIGRGCLGRPWLFGQLADRFAGRPERPPPRLGEVAAVLRGHAGLLAVARGEAAAMPQFRKHAGWYLTGYPVPPALRAALCRVAGLAELDRLLARLDPLAAVDPAALAGPRGKAGPPQKVALPEGFLADRDDPTPLAAAELAISGG